MNAWAFKLRPIADLIRSRAPSRLGWGALASIPGLALAGPSGENVVAGGAVVSRPSATETQIDQSTARAVVNWSTFSVDNDEYVVFNQPGASASILNRVVGANQSQIFGQIEANGRVFLVNPQGVYFAPGSRVDAAGLTASVMDITDNNFMSGNYVFTRPANAPDGATVENAGDISVSDGGFVVLAGDYANNTGVISARLGNVVLAAGSQMTLDLSEDGLVSFAVDAATVSSLAGANNAGQILADGGQVIMTAKVANELVATAVNNEGLLQARSVVANDGEIYLTAAGADISHAGTIDVAGEGNASGGTVNITGDGDITLAAGSRISADGAGTGNGGTVNVIADGTMAFRKDAEITAKAGSEGERGGAVELSGHEGIQVRGNLKVGKGGEVLIDPAVVQLVSSSGSYGGSYGSTIGVGFVTSQLNSGANVFISASSMISASSGVNDITATTLGSGVSAGGDLRFFINDAAGDIALAGVEINILGDFTATAGSTNGDVSIGKITAGNVRLFAGTATGNITLNTGGITAASSALWLSAGGGDINVGTMAVPGNLSLTGDNVDVDIDAGGNVNVQGNLTATATTADANITVDAVNITMGNVLAMGQRDADISFDAINDITVGNVRALAATSSASIDFSAGGNIVTNNVTARASMDSAFIDFWADNNLTIAGVTTATAAGELSISYSAGNNVNVQGAINATQFSNSYIDLDIDAGNDVSVRSINLNGTASSAYMSIDISAGRNINVGTAANPAIWNVAGSSVDVDLDAGNDINVFGTLNFSATNDYADVHFSASNNVNFGNATVAGNVNVDASWGLHLSFSAAAGNVNINGNVDASATNGSASVDINAGANVNTRNLKVRGTNYSSIDISAGGKITVGDATADAVGSSGSGSYGGGQLEFRAGTGIDAKNLAAMGDAGGASISLVTWGGNVRTAGLKAISDDNFASVRIMGVPNATTVTVGGPTQIAGTAAMFSISSARNINLNGNTSLTAPSYVFGYFSAQDNFNLNGKFTGQEAGGGFLDVLMHAGVASTINGDINLTAGPNSYAYLDIGAPEESSLPANTVTLNRNITVMSGMEANAFIYGRNVTNNGLVTIKAAGASTSGDIPAALGMAAVMDLKAGNITVTNPNGHAGFQGIAGNNMTLGRQMISGGTNGMGYALYNNAGPGGIAPTPSGFVSGKNIFANDRIDVKGGQGSYAIFDVFNNITFGPMGIVVTENAAYTFRDSVLNSGIIRSAAENSLINNPAQTPSILLDNRAFVGPSTINFNPGTKLRAASFLATGPVQFNGAFTADNLNVAVTNGTATFNSPVNITGNAPFLATAPDLALFGLMAERGLLPPVHGPNVQIFAQNGIDITNPFYVNGPSPFTKMLTNGPFNVSGLTTNSGNILAVFTPIDTTRPIFFEDEPFVQPLGASGFFNFPTISGLPDNPNVTVVIGESGPASVPLLNGDVTIGSRGGINIGDRNMFIITRGAVNGEESVVTNGVFEVIGLAEEDVFQVPIINEFGEDTTTENTDEDDEDDDDDEDDLVLGDDGDDGGDDGGISEEGSGSESMECS